MLFAQLSVCVAHARVRHGGAPGGDAGARGVHAMPDAEAPLFAGSGGACGGGNGAAHSRVAAGTGGTPAADMGAQRGRRP